MQKLKSFMLATLFMVMANASYTVAQRNEGKQGNDRQSVPRASRSGNNNQKPKWGATVQSTPKRTTLIKSSQDNYHYREGVYYRKDNSGAFRVGPAPAGIRINSLPAGYTRLILAGLSYYYYYGTFYPNTDQSGYEVVSPPVGAVVGNLPDGYEKVSIDGVSYYTFDGVYFKAFVDERGEVAYQVVGDVRG